MAKHTIDEILIQCSGDSVPDPITANLVAMLQEMADRFVRCADSLDWTANYEAALELCRVTQRLRLEVGELHTLDPVAINKVGISLRRVVDMVNDPRAFAESHYSPAQQSDGGRAIRNIADRCHEIFSAPGRGPEQPR